MVTASQQVNRRLAGLDGEVQTRPRHGIDDENIKTCKLLAIWRVIACPATYWFAVIIRGCSAGVSRFVVTYRCPRSCT